MKELKIGELVEVIMKDGSINTGEIKKDVDVVTGVHHHEIDLDLPTPDDAFYGIIVQGREPFWFWECKLKGEG